VIEKIKDAHENFIPKLLLLFGLGKLDNLQRTEIELLAKFTQTFMQTIPEKNKKLFFNENLILSASVVILECISKFKRYVDGFQFSRIRLRKALEKEGCAL
jgi:hypothetical protein